MMREQLFASCHEAFVILNNYVKHGWHGQVEPCGNMFKLVLVC